MSSSLNGSISPSINCECEMTHVHDIEPLTTKDEYDEFMSQDVKMGGGESKKRIEIIEKGMDRDFPNWREQQTVVPSVEDAGSDKAVYPVPGEVGKALYTNYTKFVFCDFQYNLEELLGEIDNFLKIATGEDSVKQAEKMQACVENIKNIQFKRECRSKSLKGVVDEIIKLSVSICNEKRNNIEPCPTKFTAFYKMGGKKTRRFELVIFDLPGAKSLFGGGPVFFTVGDRNNMD